MYSIYQKTVKKRKKFWFDKKFQNWDWAFNNKKIFTQSSLMKKICVAVVIMLLVFACINTTQDVAIAKNGFCCENVVEQNAENVSLYNGEIRHIFFHSLILYPKQAFNSKKANGYNNWMTTRDEFKAILKRLYQNDFVLVDIDFVRQSHGRGFLFPRNKKPLIISIDDVNYYDYMKEDGFAEKLIVDKLGNIATTVRTPNGAKIVDHEGDAVPILDRFVKTHPDFSFRGAKGVLGVTGFQGVFGYRVNSLRGEEQKTALQNARGVARALKAGGWKIACHSYSHSLKFKDSTITLENLKKDIEKWKLLVSSVTGQTNIFIAPYGTLFPTDDERFRYLCDAGFNIYCSVYKRMDTAFTKHCMISERLNFDGFTMLKYPSRITSTFFDLEGVIDKNRPQSTIG